MNYRKFNHIVIVSLVSAHVSASEIRQFIKSGDIEAVANLIHNDPTVVGDKAISEQSPLHYAASAQNIRIVQLLLAKDADPNSVDKGGSTPLMLSATSEYLEVSECLLQHSSDINMQNKYGETALSIAVEKGNLQLVRKLLSYNPDVNLGSPLHTAVWQGNIKMAELLVKKGADANKKNDFNRTPLRSAIEGPIKDDLVVKEIVQLLLNNKAMIHAEDKADNKVSLSAEALKRNYNATAELLASYAGDPSTAADSTEKPLE